MGIFNFLSKIFSEAETDKNPINTVTASAPSAPKQCMSAEELKARIKKCLDSIEEITYETDVPASAISASAHPAAKPVAFMVSNSSGPIAAIVIVANNTYKSMPVKGTQMLIEEKNIKYVRFFVELENTEEYITDRIVGLI